MDQFVAPVSTPTAKVRADIANIFFILDESGSMGYMKQQAITGFNKYIADQRALDGLTRLTFVKFSDQRKVVYEARDVMSVPELDGSTYKPDGYTALNDAVGWVLTNNLDKCSTDETNIIVILTDGDENSSKEYKLEQVRELLAQAEAKGWEILFLGANMTKQSVVSTYGINANNVSAFAATGKGLSDAMTTLSAGTTSYRGMKSRGISSKVDLESAYAATACAASMDSATLADLIAKAADGK
jgi:hypothetical protein